MCRPLRGAGWWRTARRGLDCGSKPPPVWRPDGANPELFGVSRSRCPASQVKYITCFGAPATFCGGRHRARYRGRCSCRKSTADGAGRSELVPAKSRATRYLPLRLGVGGEDCFDCSAHQSRGGSANSTSCGGLLFGRSALTICTMPLESRSLKSGITLPRGVDLSVR